MADSVFIGRKIIFTGAFAEFINRFSVVYGFSAVLHVDLSAAMVYVTDLLWFRGWNCDFYIFGKCEGNFTISADNLRVELDFSADTADRIDLLLHDVALFIAGVAYGNLFDELARGGWIFTGNDRDSDADINFFSDWNGFEIFL